jgi:hypothetical protein
VAVAVGSCVRVARCAVEVLPVAVMVICCVKLTPTTGPSTIGVLVGWSGLLGVLLGGAPSVDTCVGVLVGTSGVGVMYTRMGCWPAQAPRLNASKLHSAIHRTMTRAGDVDLGLSEVKRVLFFMIRIVP